MSYNDENERAEAIHLPCEACGSSDAVARYSAYTHCFSCGDHKRRDDVEHTHTKKKEVKNMDWTPIRGKVVDLKARGINKEIAGKYGYKVGKRENGELVHVVDFYDKDGKLRAQKLRTRDKQFKWLGNAKSPGLVGQHLYKPGKRLVVVEGEIDMLTVSQLFNGKWPVVSLPHGAASAERTFKEELTELEKWEQVIICFDNDDPGREAAAKCAKVLSPGKAAIANLPLKDANAMLLAGRGPEVLDCLWQAKTVQPDGVIDMKDTWDLINQKTEPGLATPYKGLDALTGGIRPGELTIVAAGTSVGKTTFVKQIIHHMVSKHKVACGCILLEENIRTTALSLMGLEIGVPLHIHGHDAPEKTKKAAFDKLFGSSLVQSYDKFGGSDVDTVARTIRHWAKAYGCKVIILDHIAALTSGDASADYKVIDAAMTRLSELIRELDISLIAISHLNRSSTGDSTAEEGGKINLSSLRGSHSLGQWADSCIALERNLQAEKEEERTVSTVRVLKNRYLGVTGVACKLKFDFNTGRMTEVPKDFKPVPSDIEDNNEFEPIEIPEFEEIVDKPKVVETQQEIDFDGF